MNTQRTKLAMREIYRLAFDIVFGGWGKVNALGYDIHDTIVIASSPRGGSTWLAEIIGSLTGYPMLWEPLHLRSNPECKKYGFTWQTFVSRDAEEPLKQVYLRKVLTGSTLSRHVVSRAHFHIEDYLHFRGFLVKFTNANLLLYWLLQWAPVRTILMIRHPCAVVASQLRHRAWDSVNEETQVFPYGIENRFPHLKQVFHRVKSREEALAFEWAIQTYVPLSQPAPHPWCLTTYERLVEQGASEVARLFEFLGFAPPEEAISRLQIPSMTAQADSNIARGKDPLQGWRQRLTADQIDSILRIVRLVGIDYYSDALLPDYEKLGLS